MDDESATLAVVVARLDDLRTDVRDLRQSVDERGKATVSRGEWEMRNRAVDARFEGQGREIAELKAARAPWWVWVAAACGVGSLLWTILGR